LGSVYYEGIAKSAGGKTHCTRAAYCITTSVVLNDEIITASAPYVITHSCEHGSRRWCACANYERSQTRTLECVAKKFGHVRFPVLYQESELRRYR
jgi:hypothetical protein